MQGNIGCMQTTVTIVFLADVIRTQKNFTAKVLSLRKNGYKGSFIDLLVRFSLGMASMALMVRATTF